MWLTVERKEVRYVVINWISYLFILLFIYAAVSKVLDFENFRIQLGQRPLLSAYAAIVAWGVPLLEIFIAILLFYPPLRMLGFYAFFFLMIMFTAYIILILNFADFVPCSCGGVLEKLSWTQHLIFNVVFIVLAGIAIYLSKHWNTRKKLILIGLLAVTGIGIVTLLFAFSEKKTHRNNAFIRRYPPFPIKLLHTYDLKYNSYYIAGVWDQEIYLGNVTTPLNLTQLDTALENKIEYRVELDAMDLPYRAVRIQIRPPYFYVFDGQVPVILKGSTTDWKASVLKSNIIFYSNAIPIRDSVFAIKAISSNTLENVIGLISFQHSTQLTLSNNLLEKQIDGIFDTDGILLWNKELEKLVYVYYYRNEFLIVNPDLSLQYKGRTIDTVSQSQLDIAFLKSKQRSKLSQKSVMVNKDAITSGNYLFIRSDRLGRFEPEEILKEATVIDIYNISKNIYEFSIYIYHLKGKKLKSFWVYQNLFIGIMEEQLVTYELNTKFFNDSIIK